MSRWDSVEMFTMVVDTGSFSAAAEKMAVSKSHVSRSIRQLENRLRVQLLNRTTRTLALTEMGEAYYQRCKQIISSMEEADQAVMDLQAKPIGTLRMTVPAGFGESYIAPAAAEFMLRHSQIRIEMDFSNRTIDLLAEGYDLAIRAGTLKDSSLIARRIAGRQLHICASPEYFARYGKPDSIAALKKHNCLVGSRPTWRFREDSGHHADIRVDGSWHANNGWALLTAAEKGLGIVQLPEFYLQKALKQGSLKTMLEEFQPRDTAVWAVYPSNRHLSPKVRLFIEFLVQRFDAVDYL